MEDKKIKSGCFNCRFSNKPKLNSPCFSCEDSSQFELKIECVACGEDITNSPCGCVDNVNHPDHYMTLPIETIKIIKIVLDAMPNLTNFEAYCIGNDLKYRLRTGFKVNIGETLEEAIIRDIKKALKYKEFREAI